MEVARGSLASTLLTCTGVFAVENTTFFGFCQGCNEVLMFSILTKGCPYAIIAAGYGTV